MKLTCLFIVGAACGWLLAGAWFVGLNLNEVAICVAIIAAALIVRSI